jgi:hypothetical protein
MPSISADHIILEARRLVESDRRSEIRLNANGGNSILVVCDPMQELNYIDAINRLLPTESYSVIDLNKCLLDFVRDHYDSIMELFDLLQSSTHEIFKAPKEEESQDLYKEIISMIVTVFNEKKVPVLINAGALYGTGIDNIHIMENDLIMKSKYPLIILYPATREADRLMFLGKRPASKYRCMIIQ